MQFSKNRLQNKSRESYSSKKRVFKIAVITLAFFLTSNIMAQEETVFSNQNSNASGKEFNQALSMCPGGIAFGIYSVNYMRMLDNRHGLVARLDYEAIPKKYTNANIESSGYAFVLNYRYHFSGEMESYYVGAFFRHRVFSGTGEVESGNFDFEIPEQTYGLIAGKRWIWNSGFTINFTLGYGISSIGRSADPSNAAVQNSLDEFENSYDFIDPVLGEFSIGFAF